ncbi:uncharacterized protein LOC136026209 [Artemia franciscana]
MADSDQPVMYMCSKCSQLYSDLEEFKSHQCLTGDEEVYLPEGEGVDSGLVDQQHYDESQQYQTDMGELSQAPEELMGQMHEQGQEEGQMQVEHDAGAHRGETQEPMDTQGDIWTHEVISILLESVKKHLQTGKFGDKLWTNVSIDVVSAASVPTDVATAAGVREKWVELMKNYVENRARNQTNLSPFVNELEYFYDNFRQVYVDTEKGKSGPSPFWTEAKALDLVRIMSREKSRFDNDAQGKKALYTQVATILSKQHGSPVTPGQVTGKYNRILQTYQKITGATNLSEDPGFFDNLLSFIVEEGGLEDDIEEEEPLEEEKVSEPETGGEEEATPKRPVNALRPVTKTIPKAPVTPVTPAKKATKTKWSLELAKVLITIVKDHHKLLETGATSESQFFEHCSKWLKDKSGAELDGSTLQAKYNRMRSEFDTYLSRQGERPKEMPMSQYLAKMEAKLKEHVDTSRSKAAAPATPAAPAVDAFQWNDKATRMFLRILRHFTKAVEANDITVDQVCKDAADILQSYVKLNVTGEQCRRRWLELTARHTAIGKPGTKPSFAKSLSILEKTFGIEKMEEGDKAEASSEEGKEEGGTTEILKNRPGITLSKVALPKDSSVAGGTANGLTCGSCGKFDKVLSTLLRDERDMRRKEHEAMVRVMKDQADAILTLKNAVQALTKVCQHISSAQENINKQLPKLAGARRLREDEGNMAKKRRTGD